VINKRALIAEQAERREIEVLLLDGFDNAIIGLVDLNWHGGGTVVAYSVNEIIEQLIQDGCSREDAYEYFHFNVEGAYLGPNTPIFIEDEHECANQPKP